MSTILYVTFAPVTNYLGVGLQIDTALTNGYNVKILEINSLFDFPTPEHSEKYSRFAKPVKSIKELTEIILANNPVTTIVNVQMMYEWRFRSIFRLMAKHPNYNFSIFLLGQLPFHAYTPIWGKIIKSAPLKLPYRISTRLLSKFLFKIKYFTNQNILFYAGETLSNAKQYLKSYPINYFDYDAYLEDPIPANENYILFLDDALFQHPDDKLAGNIIEDSTVKSYQKSLNNYFDFIESSTQLKIVIASHPKVTHLDNFFGNRKVVKNSTQKLVKNATLILSHCSSSVSFAACYKKPIIFLTNNTIFEFSKKYQPFHQYIQNFAKHLERPLINTDDSFRKITDDLYDINQEKYEIFIIDYLTTHETQNKLSKNVIIDYFLDILRKK